MSTLGKLRTAVLGYLQTEFPGVSRHSLLNNSTPVDVETKVNELFIVAANNARKTAEIRHDFQCAECTLEGTIPTDGSGLSWDAMVDEEEQVQKLRSVQAVYVENDGTLIPVTVQRKNLAAKKKWDRAQRRIPSSEPESCGQAKIVHWGRRFYCDPTNDEEITLVVEGYKDLEDYNQDGLVDAIDVSGTLTDGTDPVVFQTMYLTPEPMSGGVCYSSVEGNDDPTTYPDGIYYTIKSVFFVFEGKRAWRLLKISVTAGVVSVLATWQGTKRVASSNDELRELYPPFDEETWTPTSPATGTPILVVNYNSTTDYFLQRGFPYMMWATICELNYLIKRFVYRQEGNLTAPTKERDEALEALIADDSYAVESTNYHDIRDDE